MPRIRRDMVGMGPGMMNRGSMSHGAQQAGLGAPEDLPYGEDDLAELMKKTVAELLLKAQDHTQVGDSDMASWEMARRLDDSYPKLYTYVGVGVALGVGGLIGWALAG